jgi:sugar/nucleoside kinase (ribokinase family)
MLVGMIQSAAPPKSYDCIVCGSCVIDVLCRPVPLDRPLGAGILYEADPVVLTGGGITSNSGITMATMGLDVGVLSYVGDDAWGPVMRQLYRDAGMDITYLATHPTEPTSTTMVAIDENAERTFYHCVGAPKKMDADMMLDHLELFSRTRILLLGYYTLMPQLEGDLSHIFAKVREVGCQTALDAAGHGGSLQPLDKILPHLDVYVPSLAEAKNQTGCDDPVKIIETYRNCGAPGVLGVKLGSRGAMLSPAAGEYIEVPVVTPPGDVIDTTGAGDSFYAGLITGLLDGLSLEDAGKLAAAAGACCCTAVGGSSGARDMAFVKQLAGIE